jgi:hypothetical protein
MSSSNLWTSNSTHRVFDWENILALWQDEFSMPHSVKVVMQNLQAASDPYGSHSPTLAQFLTYMDYEQTAIAWFLYECIAVRWMHGHIRVDYIRSLVDEIEELDTYFPSFPGSPHQTIRQFIESSLTQEELSAIEMLPPLVRANSYSYESPQRETVAPSLRRTNRFTTTLPSDTYSTSVPTIRRSLSERFAAVNQNKNKYGQSMQLRFIRNMKSDGATDDILTIKRVGDDSYTLVYNDQESSIKTKKLKLTSDGVIEFLKLTLRLVSVDEEPFHSVQITLPSFPAIIVSPENLISQTRDLIYDSVEATMRNWPVSV